MMRQVAMAWGHNLFAWRGPAFRRTRMVLAGPVPFRAWMGVLLGLALAACAQREGVLLPVDIDAPAGSRVDMLVATPRAPSDAPGVVFSGERSTSLSLANVVVSVPPNRQVGTIQWPRHIPPDPTREFAVTRVDPLTKAGAAKWYNTQPANRRRVLVFVHGFNTRFDASVFRFAQFIHDTDANLVPVLFSWPSRGRVSEYIYDRESTNFSRADLATVLEEAARSRHVDEVVVLAHSMGAWLTMEALRDLALRNGRVPAKISSVILASPDLDVDVFERQMEELGPKRPHVAIFVDRHDKALGLSGRLAGRVTRVGAMDMSDPAYQERLGQGSNIVVLDLTALKAGDALQHSHFATTPEVVQLFGQKMMDGQRMDENTEGLDRASHTMRLVASTPIELFVGGVTGQ